ncbi:RNA polymerase sigma factor [Verrucomicrobiaceae bacterium 227]
MPNPPPSSNLVNASDAQLVEAAGLGNRKAFVEIVHRYQNIITGVTLAILRDFSLSEDAAQEAFILAWQKMSTLKDGGKLRPWLCQIARNTALNHARKRRPEDELERSLIDPSPRPDEVAISRDERATVLSVLESLPEKYRLPLVLYYREDQSIRTVAKTLSQSEASVRKQLSRGRNLLKGQMADLLKSALPRTTPGPVFTATVAGLIGAMLKPTAIAATAFTTKPLTASATAMTSSKLTLTTAAVISAVCIPVGYTARTLVPSDEIQAPAIVTTARIPESQRESYEPALSPIALEWQALLASCQNDPKAFPDLYQTISEIPGSLRREAFHSLLLAEWVTLDPVNGLAFVRGLNDSQWQQELFAKEWIRQDIHAAIDGLLSGGPGWDFVGKVHLADIREGEGWSFIVGRQLDEIGIRAPERLKEVVEALPMNNFVRTWVAFSNSFAVDPKAAIEAANSLTGKRREEALSGIAHGWSNEDLAAALDWAQSTEDPALRAILTSAAIRSLAWRDPLHALEYLKTAPPGMDGIGATAISTLAENDFPAALKWAAQNPVERYLTGLSFELQHRFVEDPLALVNAVRSAGALENLASMLSENHLLKESPETQTLVWGRLLELENDSGASLLRKEIIAKIYYENPGQLIDLVERVPTGPERDSLAEQVVQGMVKNARPRSGSHDPQGKVEHEENLLGMVSATPRDWQGKLIEEAFKELKDDHFLHSEHLDRWESYFDFLPEAGRQDAAKKIAFGIGRRSPEKMDPFFSSLKTEDERFHAGAAYVGSFRGFDIEIGTRWLANTPMTETLRTKIRVETDPWK